MFNLDQTLSLAKRGKLTRAETYAAMQALAEQRREPGMSEAQAFAKLIATQEGSELYQIQKSLPGRDIDPTWSSPVAKAVTNDWDALVNNLMRLQKCSRGKAIDAALSTEEGRALFAAQKRAEQIATGQYSAADISALDAANAQQKHHADLHKRATRSEFEGMVAKLRQSKTHLTESQAQDHVRGTPAGKSAWLAFKGTPGRNGVLPQG